MRSLFYALILVALALGGWYFASPWLAMKDLRDAAQATDLAALDERVDLEAVGESLKLQLRDRITDETEDRGVLERIGGRIASSASDRVVDLAVTPGGVATLVSTGAFVLPLLPDRLRGQAIEWRIEREGFNRFRAPGTFEDGTAGPVLVWERRGIGWELTGVELLTLE